MAKRSSESGSGTDKAKVRVFFAEVDGNNDSIQEALRTMVSAMSRPVRVISDQRTNGKPVELLAADVEEIEEEIEQDAEVNSSEEEASARKARGTGKKIDRNAGLSLVPDLNFRPAGQKSLKEFIERKKPQSDVEIVMLVVHYMQHTMKLPKIGPAHVMTALKDVGKAIPVDLRQTIRNLKKSKAWLNFTDIEDIRSTTQGDNFVEHEMGKSDAP
jgi:hypothetical protein